MTELRTRYMSDRYLPENASTTEKHMVRLWKKAKALLHRVREQYDYPLRLRNPTNSKLAFKRLWWDPLHPHIATPQGYQSAVYCRTLQYVTQIALWGDNWNDTETNAIISHM